jgi:hypothetical protein
MPKQGKSTGGKSKATPASPEAWAPARTLFNRSDLYLTSADVARAAQLLAVTNAQIQIELAARLQSIARRYWEQHRDAQRPPAKWYRTQIAEIERNIGAALALLRSAKGTALSQLKFRTERRMGRPLLELNRTDPHSIESILDEFVATCNSCAFLAPRGAPRKEDIKEAVAALRNVWVEYKGEKFPLNLSQADARKDHGGQRAQERDDVFTSPGPSFVHEIMLKIDSSVKINATASALREADRAARSV